MKAEFTHYWVTGFGWENTIYLQGDFVSVEILGQNETDGTVFLCINELGGKHLIKGNLLNN